ncbi:MAG: pilus assembly protein PilM, partial [Planctomycetota bacterium]
GEKLLRASGGNERIEKLVATLKTRLTTAKKETGCELAVWASAADTQGDSTSARITVLPCCSTATWKVSLDAKAMQSWRQNFFEWQIAGGAAVQLLGLGRVNTNLAPPKKKGLFRRKDSVPADCLGVAISGTTAHMVRVQIGDDGNPIIAAYDIQRLAGNTETARATAIQELLDRNEVDGLPIAATVAARHCISRYSEVPKFDNEKKQTAAVEFEAKHQIPFPLEGLCWDKYIGDENVTEDLATIDVLLLASRKEHIEETIASFGDRASDVGLVQCDALALQNWASTAWSGVNSVGKSRAVISIGERETHVAVIGQSSPFHNTVSWGINDVRLTIEKQLELNPKEVEVILRAASQAKRITPVAEAFEASYEDLVGQLRRSFTGFERASTGYKSVEEIVLMGEGCTLFGLARYLRLNPPTE